VDAYVRKFFCCSGCGLSESVTLCCGCICVEVFSEFLAPDINIRITLKTARPPPH